MSDRQRKRLDDIRKSSTGMPAVGDRSFLLYMVDDLCDQVKRLTEELENLK